MNQKILFRIKQLGGNIDNIRGNSLQEDVQAIRFDTVLYQRPEDTPWQTAEQAEPIVGIEKFLSENKELIHENEEAFYNKLINQYYRITEEGYGQLFFTNKLFTPFREGTADFDEWNTDFAEDDLVDLNEVYELTNDPTPDFIQIFYSYGFPDHYYVCLSDPNPENPTLFGTDHEVFFGEVTNEGSLEDFLNTFMTKEELIALVRKRVGN